MSLNIKKVDEGKIIYLTDEINVNDLKWNETAYKGVFLKHLVKGESTDNRLSCHVVKIKPDARLVNISMKGKWNYMKF